MHCFKCVQNLESIQFSIANIKAIKEVKEVLKNSQEVLITMFMKILEVLIILG